jgi:hypothetical protein
MSDQRCGRCGGVVGDFPPCGCATKEPVVVHPAPKAIRIDAIPFVGCFKRMENELAAALYVWWCAENGNAWQLLSFPTLYEFCKARSADKNLLSVQPSFFRMLCDLPTIGPDFRALVTLGVFAEEVAPVTASDGETVSRVCIAPTPSFFEVLHSKKLVLS